MREREEPCAVSAAGSCVCCTRTVWLQGSPEGISVYCGLHGWTRAAERAGVTIEKWRCKGRGRECRGGKRLHGVRRSWARRHKSPWAALRSGCLGERRSAGPSLLATAAGGSTATQARQAERCGAVQQQRTRKCEHEGDEPQQRREHEGEAQAAPRAASTRHVRERRETRTKGNECERR